MAITKIWLRKKKVGWDKNQWKITSIRPGPIWNYFVSKSNVAGKVKSTERKDTLRIKGNPRLFHRMSKRLKDGSSSHGFKRVAINTCKTKRHLLVLN